MLLARERKRNFCDAGHSDRRSTVDSYAITRYSLRMKTTDDLLRAILAILPEATIDEDLEGQIVIYTNKKEADENGTLVDFEA